MIKTRAKKFAIMGLQRKLAVLAKEKNVKRGDKV